VSPTRAIVAAGLLLVGCAGLRAGDDGAAAPAGPIRDRQALMKDMAAEAQDITQAFDIGAEGFDVAMIARAAQQMAANAHQIPALFPAGSTAPQSRALPLIWQRWSTFEQIAGELEQSAFSLSQAASAGDDENLDEKSIKVFHHCRACHDEFRRPKAKPGP
jgi:cytochrome c556